MLSGLLAVVQGNTVENVWGRLECVI
ncbi:hypothetical protein ACETIH_23845 [Microvirga arabica]|uniref:Transposase n=1 Tax=Microvirga arabica TaxID=1128671 RepID=A0ABV6YEI9_9HYPH